MPDGTPLHMDKFAHVADGVVLINRAGLESAFTGVKHLDADDLEHGRELRDWLYMPPQILPEIRVPVEIKNGLAA